MQLRGGLPRRRGRRPASGRSPACPSACARSTAALITGWSGTAQESVSSMFGIVEMLLGHLDHQQRARRIGGIGLVVGGLPGVGDAGLDEDDQRRRSPCRRASASGRGTCPARRAGAPPRARRRRGSGRRPWRCARGPSSRTPRASGRPRRRGGCPRARAPRDARARPARRAAASGGGIRGRWCERSDALQIGVAVEVAFQERPLGRGRS